MSDGKHRDKGDRLRAGNFRDFDYDPIGGHTEQEAREAYETLFRQLHGDGVSESGARGQVAVVGHKQPDIDCVCAAICLAALKNHIDPDNVYTPFSAGNLDARTRHVLDRFGVAAPREFAQALESESAAVILVDHNSADCAPDGLDPACVREIIDRHKPEPLPIPRAIEMRIQPIGATSTIVALMYEEFGAEVTPETAGLLCAGIVSETCLFTTPETSELDRLSAAALANIAGLDLQKFAAELGVR